MAAMSKAELENALKMAQSLLKKYGQSTNATGKGLIPIFAVGLTAFDQNKIQEVAAFMARPGMHAFHHAPGIRPSNDRFYRKQQTGVLAALKTYLGPKAGIPNTKGIIDDLLKQLADL